MMRLGISLQEGYLIILATLIVLQGAGTIYGLWAQGRAATPEAVRRLAVANSRVRMGWWLIIVFTVAWWWGMASLVVLFAIFSFFLLKILFFVPEALGASIYRKPPENRQSFDYPICHVNSVAPQVRPPPKPASTSRSPFFSFPCRFISSNSTGTVAADVLP